MKVSTNVVKFSLTLVCAAVLAACSSGGGSDNSAAEAKAKQEAAQAQKAAAEKAAAEKAAAEKAAAEKAAAEKAAAEKAAAEKAAAEKAAAEEAKVAASESVGHKLVKKTDSNFALAIKDEKNGTQSSRSTGRSDNMDIKLYPSLDTVVVSVPLKKGSNGEYVIDEKAPIGYVEDFDFRGNVDKKDGQHTLNHIYKTNGSTTGSTNTREETATKTNTAGTDEGTALVYQDGRTNYIPTDEKVTGVKVRNDFRDRKETVAEVYGHRTFVYGDSFVGADANGNYHTSDIESALKQEGTEVEGDNAPFGKKDAKGQYNSPHRLDNVQYGRVTSRLHDVKPNATKAGLNVGKNGTKVVSYGDYGKTHTENSYFYRGVNDTPYSKTLSSDLANAYAKDVNGVKTPAASLSYEGHAVTYGFTHAPQDSDRGRVPNAIGAKSPVELVSGTHVHAEIDLATKNVTGNLYDIYSNGPSDIATFKGTLDNAGTIAGQSTRVADKAEGTFNGNLFGKNGEELGGALASKATGLDKAEEKKSWGAVFGASVQNTLYQPVQAVKPVQPVQSEPEKVTWGVKSDENN